MRLFSAALPNFREPSSQAHSKEAFPKLHNLTTASRKSAMLQLISEYGFCGGCDYEKTFDSTAANRHIDDPGEMSQKKLPACYAFNAQRFIGIRLLSEKYTVCMDVLNSCGQ